MKTRSQWMVKTQACGSQSGLTTPINLALAISCPIRYLGPTSKREWVWHLAKTDGKLITLWSFRHICDIATLLFVAVVGSEAGKLVWMLISSLVQLNYPSCTRKACNLVWFCSRVVLHVSEQENEECAVSELKRDQSKDYYRVTSRSLSSWLKGVNLVDTLVEDSVMNSLVWQFIVADVFGHVL